jgi:phosphoserine aminotransferase
MTASASRERLFNFSAGPAAMPLEVLQKAQADMLCLPGAGASILEISHRSDAYIEIQSTARQRLIRLLGIGDDYEVLFLQGGSRLQFSMLAMNLMQPGAAAAQYVVTGSWGKQAFPEAVRHGAAEIIWDGKSHNYSRLPEAGEVQANSQAAYVHVTSNETIQGVQFPTDLQFGDAPLVCDSSSDFLSRPVPVDRYGLIYACAQKNAGPAGVTVVIIRRDLLQRSTDDLPGYLDYRNHSEGDSMWNTPPTFAVYMLGLVAEWLEETVGGLAAMHEHNHRKAGLVYASVDRHPNMFQGHADRACRSLMNVTFRLPSPELEKQFLAGAAERGLDSLKGHRSVGGIRASIYNAMPVEGAEALADYMEQFAQQHG